MARAHLENACERIRPLSLLIALVCGALSPPPALAQSITLPGLESTTTKSPESDSTPSAATLQSRIETWQARAAHFRDALAQAPAKVGALDQSISEAQKSASSPPNLSDVQGGDALNHALDIAEQELALAQQRKSEADTAEQALTQRRQELPVLLAGARAALRTAQEAVPLEPTADVASDAPSLQQLRVRALEAELAAHEAELRSHDARSAVVEHQRTLAALRVQLQQARVEALRERVRKSQQEQILEDAQQAQEQLQHEPLSPTLRQTVQAAMADTTQMTESWTGEDGLQAAIAHVQQRLATARQQVEAVQESHARIAARVRAASMADSVGALLRKERAQAPDVGMYRRFVRMRQDEIAQAQLENIRLRERRDSLADVEGRVQAALQNADLPEAHEQRIADLLRKLFSSQLRYLDLLIADHDTYFQGLVDFDVEQRQLIEASQALIDFIDTHVLWVPSGPLTNLDTFAEAPTKLAALADPRLVTQLQRAFLSSTQKKPGTYAALLFLLLAHGLLRLRSHHVLTELVERSRLGQGNHFTPTLLSLLVTLVLALLPPVLLFSTAYLLGTSKDATHYVRAVASGVKAAAILWATLRVGRQGLREDGPLHGHLDQPLARCRRLSRYTALLGAVAVPIVGLIYTLEARGDEAGRETAGRLLFVALMIAAAVYGQLVLRPLSAVAAAVEPDSPVTKLSRSGPGRTTIRALSMMVPLGLAGAALLGFYWTALQMCPRIHFTALLVLMLLFLGHMLQRWAELARQRVAVARSQAALESALLEAAADEAARSTNPDVSGSLDSRPSIHVNQLLDLDSVSTQTRRLLTVVLVTVGALGVFSIWADLLPAANLLHRVELWDTVREVSVVVPDAGGTEHRTTEQQQVPVTLWDLLLSLSIAGFSWLLLRNLPGLIEMSLFQRLQGGERYAYATIVKYTIGLVGGALALDALGVSWASIQWLVAAVGLGLGFGLQEIFANFVSGLIILFERPIRVGDTVTIGEISGTVSRIRIRATWITGFDRKELVVPNKEFVSNRLINWTLSDQVLRVELPIGIAYGSDTRKAIAILDRLARRNRVALSEPEPRVLFQSFGDSALLFELRVYVASPDHVLQIRHELNLAIDDAFREADITIAFPQLDVHVGSMPDMEDTNPTSKKNASPAKD